MFLDSVKRAAVSKFWFLYNRLFWEFDETTLILLGAMYFIFYILIEYNIYKVLSKELGLLMINTWGRAFIFYVNFLFEQNVIDF